MDLFLYTPQVHKVVASDLILLSTERPALPWAPRQGQETSFGKLLSSNRMQSIIFQEVRSRESWTLRGHTCPETPCY